MNPDIQETIRSMAEKREQASQKQEQAGFEEHKMDHLLSHLALFIDHMVGELQGATYKGRVVNFPSVQKVKGEVTDTGTPSLIKAMEAIKEEVKALKESAPETVKVTGTVTVGNPTDLSKLKIPEPYKRVQAEVESMPKYVREGLEKIEKAVKAIKVSPQVSVSPAPPAPVNISLFSLESKLQELTDLTRLLLAREMPEVPETDLVPLIQAELAVEQAIRELKFPIPNFQSSWQHSRYMQSLDGDMVYHYLAHSSGRKVTDYLQVTLGDGTYRQTFTFDSDGDVITKTAWVKQ